MFIIIFIIQSVYSIKKRNEMNLIKNKKNIKEWKKNLYNIKKYD